MMKTIEIIFKPTQILDARKSGSTLEIGQRLKGNMQLSNNCVFWEDLNGQEWAFWIGDTAELVEIQSKGMKADLYRFFLNLKENHDYWGLCTENEIKDFCNRNNIEFNIKYGAMETGSYLLSKTYSVEETPIYFFEVIVYTKKFGGEFVEKKYWYGYNIDWFQRWKWFFNYCSALLQIKYPRYYVETKWGTKKPELAEDFNVLKVRKAQKDIVTCKRMITKYQNAISQYVEIENTKLIPNWENEKYLKALVTLEMYKNRLHELETIL